AAPPRVDFVAVAERLRRLRSQLSHADSAARFASLGVDLYFGSAAFSGPDRVNVGGATLQFARAVIATGASPADPGLSGLNKQDYLTNETIFNLTELPKRLLILGGGPVGCELAQAFARFGSEVHLVNRSRRILAREEPEASALIQHRMRHDGVIFHLG